jgi:hypothetical protein
VPITPHLPQPNLLLHNTAGYSTSPEWPLRGFSMRITVACVQHNAWGIAQTGAHHLPGTSGDIQDAGSMHRMHMIFANNIYSQDSPSQTCLLSNIMHSTHAGTTHSGVLPLTHLILANNHSNVPADQSGPRVFSGPCWHHQSLVPNPLCSAHRCRHGTLKTQYGTWQHIRLSLQLSVKTKT